jgi:hypothetical protein
MKTFASLALIVPLVGCTLPAQTESSTLPPPPAVSAVVNAPFTAEQLEQLVAPIALYPDALIALILPASTNTADVVLAARFLQGGGDPAQADNQPWDDSVQALARYPQVVRWMDENLAWTKQLGEAFAAQPDDVMSAVQRMRAKAKANGALVNTPQQQVVYEGGTIMIVPTQPDVIYVPYYDPSVVFYRSYYDYPYDTFLGFSAGFATGWWLSYGLDWHNHRVWCVARNDRQRFWHEHERDWPRHAGTWDRDRDHRPDGRRPEIRTWHPNSAPRPRTWTAATRPPHVPAVVRPTTPRVGWNDAPRTDLNRHSTDPRRWHSESPQPRRGVAPAAVGPTGSPQTRPNALPQVNPLPIAREPGNRPIEPARAGRSDRGETRWNRTPPARVTTSPATAPTMPRVPSATPRFQTPPSTSAVRTAPPPRPAPSMRMSAPPAAYHSSPPSYSPPAARTSPPPPPPSQSSPPPSRGPENNRRAYER